MHDELLDESLLGSSTPEWDSKTITRINDAKIELNAHLKQLKRGRLILWGMTGLSVLGIFAGSYFNPYDADLSGILIEGLILISVFSGSALFFNRNPLVAMSISLGVYLAFQLLTGLAFPESLARGIIIKIIIVAGLGSGIYAASEAKRYLKLLRGYGVPKKELENYFSELTPVPRTPRQKKPEA
ncbi:hypothetical protein [Neolewinella persica]|uniref:hypothetical protein n=1 Tax=Neolewinella persica TaxID=70998 RepID=UPI000377A4BA|nr:hypothetical protein [Neolewinella persica]